ncbi:sorbosone dehydrogenase family protein [Geomicrobium sp. JSM 1781026]|uniref:PQQ-dependent sugar dehydrogenase n=1 Tax=Geomicrobium sp. JSM 1781026 TaxID=3344580 RepID=UPI0035C23A2C
MKKYTMIFGASVLMLGACSPEEPQEEESEETTDGGSDELGEDDPTEGEPEPADDEDIDEDEMAGDYETLAENLAAPWGITLVDDGTVYVTEREGQIIEITDGETTPMSLALDEEVHQEGEGGLHGMVLHPEDEDTAIIYHTYVATDGIYNRIVEIERDGDEWQETDVLIEDIPGATTHNGGRLAIGPDGYLYATTGDAEDPELSQDTDSLAGKILRMNLDGTVAEDNPFDDSYVYSYGHRNPQGLDWTDDDRLFSTEHGPTANDEINHIEPGNNYGWPEIVGDETEEGMETAVMNSGEETWAPSGAAMVGEQSFYVAALAGEQLIRFDVDDNTTDTILEGEGRWRDVVYDENENMFYVITNNTDGRGDPIDEDDRLLSFEGPEA